MTSDTQRTLAFMNQRIHYVDGYEYACGALELALGLEHDLNILIEAIRDECDIPEGIRQALLKVTGGIE